MNTNTSACRRLLGSSSLACIAVIGISLSTPALAQARPQAAPAQDDAAPGTQQAAVADQTAADPQVPAGSAQTSATAAAASGDQPADVVVTGSLARRTSTETPSPVTVLTSENLARAGITNVNDAIRSVSADSAGSISTGFQNGFSAGGAAVSLRGLGVSSTLILIDGLRSANYPLNDDGHNAYTDLNSIPFSTVERVEVLKDGASSLYGADAIGGVVNLITKKHITGVAGTVEGGVSEHGDAGRYRASLTAGVGDYQSRGWNLYVSGEYERGEPVFNRGRGFPYNTYDLSSIGGLDENRFDDSLTVATTNAVVVRTSQSNLNNPLSGGVLTAEQAAGGSFATYTSLNLNCANGSYTVATGSARGTGCRHNSPEEDGEILPRQERYSFSGRLSFRLGDATEGYVTGSYAHNQVFIEGRGGASGKSGSLGPRPIRDTQPFGAAPSLASSNPGIVLPVYVCSSGVNCATAGDRRLNPNNPYAAAYANDPANGAARIYYLFGDTPLTRDRNYRVLRGTAGLSGRIGDGFDWRIEGAATETKLVLTDTGYLNVQGLLNAINTGSYNFVNPSLNSDAVRRQVSPTIVTPSSSSLYSLDASIGKSFLELPGGSLQVSVGGQVRREQLANNSVNPTQGTYNASAAAAFGKHTITAAFFEVSAPVLTSLEIDASGRYDHYSEGFGHFSPKIGVKFSPIRELALRGTFERGFRAPNFAENDARSSFAGFSSFLPTTVPGCAFVVAHGGSGAGGTCSAGGNPYSASYSLGQAVRGNPDLKPELSRSFTAGMVLQPARWFSLTADYYNVRKTDVITTGPLLGAAKTAYFSAANLTAAQAAVAALGAGYSVNTVDGVDPAFPNALPRVVIINVPYVNAARINTSGIDVTATLTAPLGANARFTSRFEVTAIFNYDLTPGAGAPTQHFVGTIGPYELSSGAGTPKWRANWQNTLQLGPLALTGTAYYVSRIKNVAADEGPTHNLSCADNLYGTGDSFCYIHSFIDVDLNATITANDRFSFFFNVKNLLGAQAPVAPASYSGVNYLPSWHLQGAIGRTFSAGANFKF